MDMNDFYERARTDLMPKMRESALCVTILGDPDPKLCMEVGAAVLMGKPIVVVAQQGRTIPESLRSVAMSVVELDAAFSTAHAQQQIQTAIGQAVEVINSRNGSSS